MCMLLKIAGIFTENRVHTWKMRYDYEFNIEFRIHFRHWKQLTSNRFFNAI